MSGLKNGTCWKDSDGNFIQAHGGCILKYKDYWYWYGENRDIDKVDGNNVFGGFCCYKTRDFVNWKNCGIVLAAEKVNSKSDLYYAACIGERPKVIYEEKSGKFVMWFHLDTPHYAGAKTGLALSDTPEGPFVFVKGERPNGRESRDMTFFKDDDGRAYIISSSEGNATLLVSELSADYTTYTGANRFAFAEQFREAPVVIKEDGVYYMFTSTCTGWAPNPMLYATSPSMFGAWRLLDNPCIGDNRFTTYDGQGACAVKLNGQNYIMLDHWKPDNLRESAYSLLPIVFENGKPRISWTEFAPGLEDSAQ